MADSRKGDTGLTDSIAQKNIRKDDKRIIALAHLDRLSAELGFAKLEAPAIKADLENIQKTLIEVMGIISGTGKKLDAKYLLFLEKQSAAPIKEFVLPGVNRAEAALHLARTAARLAETACVAAAAPQEVLAYINRLSLYLFYQAVAQSGKTP